MLLFNRILFAAVLALGLAGAASAATMPTVKVFGGTVFYDAFVTPGMPGEVDTIVFPSLISGPGGTLFEFSAGAVFDLAPLGGNVSGFFLNIFDAALSPALVGGDLLGAPAVFPGPTADVLFTVVDGSILSMFRPTALLRLSGLDEAGGTVGVEIFMAPIPLPAAAPMLLAGIALIIGLRHRRRT